MSIVESNLSVVIVSYFSDDIIHDCIKSIPTDIKIIVVDNTKNKIFKKNIEEKYENVQCILSSGNIGMGSGNNLGLKNVITDYALILNPDVTLEKNTITELILGSKKIENFSIIAPLLNVENFFNYHLLEKDILPKNKIDPFMVKSVDGFAMLLNLKRLRNIKDFQFFDENIFLFLENDDLCKRLIDINEKIFIIPNSKINHIGGGAVDKKYKQQIELSRNWHWVWSKYYFNKKHYGFLTAFSNGLPTFLSGVIKFFFYFTINNSYKKKIYLHRALGFWSAFIGKKSYLRPIVKN